MPSLSNASTNILSEIFKFEIPVLFILGTQSSIERFNSLNAGVEIDQANNSFTDIMGAFNTEFSLFEMTKNENDYFKNYPPLTSPFGNYKITGESNVLA